MRDLSTDGIKRKAAETAVDYVKDGMIVGLGTGSTAKHAIEIIGARVLHGLSVRGVPTSLETERLAKRNNIPVLAEFDNVDVTIDGADEVDPNGYLIKGGGGALTREKIVASASRMEIIIVDESKMVDALGAFHLPIEVLPFGWQYVKGRIEGFGCTASLRLQKDQTRFLTDNENLVLDCDFGRIENPVKLEEEIGRIPGVVENGLFIGLADLVIVGHTDGTTSTSII